MFTWPLKSFLQDSERWRSANLQIVQTLEFQLLELQRQSPLRLGGAAIKEVEKKKKDKEVF